MKKQKEKLSRLQILMTAKEKEELKKTAFKERRTMSNVVFKAYKTVYGKN